MLFSLYPCFLQFLDFRLGAEHADRDGRRGKIRCSVTSTTGHFRRGISMHAEPALSELVELDI